MKRLQKYDIQLCLIGMALSLYGLIYLACLPNPADAQTVIKRGNPQSRVTSALFVNSTSGAAMTGLTGAAVGVAVTPTAGVAGSITITYSVNGGTSTNATGTIAESPLGGGAYDYTPSATEANTTFDVKYKFSASGAYDYFATVAFNAYKVDDLGVALIPTMGAIAAGSSGVTIDTALTAPAVNCYKGQVLVFTSGVDAGQTYLVSANAAGANSVLTLLTAPGSNPAAADTFSLVVGVGQKIVDALSALGSDNRPKVSADAHTAGATIAAVTGNVGGSVNSVVGSIGGNVQGSVFLDVGGRVLGQGSSAFSGVGVQSNVTQIAGQTASAGAAVTFPASVGTSNYSAPADYLSAGERTQLTAAGSAGDPWATLLTSETTSGSFGALLKQFQFDSSGYAKSAVWGYGGSVSVPASSSTAPAWYHQVAIDSSGNAYVSQGGNTGAVFFGGYTGGASVTNPVLNQLDLAAIQGKILKTTIVLGNPTAYPINTDSTGAVALPATAPTGYGGSGTAPTAHQNAVALLNTAITPGGLTVYQTDVLNNAILAAQYTKVDAVTVDGQGYYERTVTITADDGTTALSTQITYYSDPTMFKQVKRGKPTYMTALTTLTAQ